MAKMFYNLGEAASRLGLNEDEVKALVDEGKLQQFRDRDKLMFKREQVDDLAASGETGINLEGDDTDDGTDELSLEDTVASLSGKTDEIDVMDEEDASEGTSLADGTALNLELDDESADSDVGTGALTFDDEGADEEAPVAIEETAPISLSDTTGIDLQLDDDPGASGAQTVELASEHGKGKGKGKSGSVDISLEEEDDLALDEVGTSPMPSGDDTGMGTRGGATGISVFDSQELEPADSMARTSMGESIGDDSGEEELNLESVGSGSGLLDLTREADDTSLGAVELLDEIAPEDEESVAGGTIGGSVAGTGTGVFADSGVEDVEDAGTGTATAEVETEGEEEVDAEAEAELPELEEEEGEVLAPARYGPPDGEDPVGDAWGGAALLGVFAILVVGTMIAFTSLQGLFLKLTQQFTTLANKSDPQQALYIMLGGLLGANVLLLIIGLVFGKMRAKRG